MMLYFIGSPKWCQVNHQKGLSPQLPSVCSSLDSEHVCIYTFQLCFLEFLKAVHFMLVGLFSSNSYQSIFFVVVVVLSFLIYSIQCRTHLITAKRFKLPSKYTQMYRQGQVCKNLLHLSSLWISNRSALVGEICYFYTFF